MLTLLMLPPETPRTEGGGSAPVRQTTGWPLGSVEMDAVGVGVADGVGVGEVCA
jgi:hypothetical protein